MVSKAIKSAQTQVEQQNFEIRKNVLKYDEVMNSSAPSSTTSAAASSRARTSGQVESMITDVITAYVNGAASEGYVEDWDLEQLWSALKTLYPVGIDYKELVGAARAGDSDLDREGLLDALLKDAHDAYAKREQQINEIAGEGGMRELERRVMLSVLDRKWREHLYEMDYLKEGIGLRAMAQRDPLVEYPRGLRHVHRHARGLKEESVGFLFNLQVEAGTPQGGGAPVSVTAASAAAAAAGGPALGQQSAPASESAPAAPVALRAKGLDDEQPRGLTLSGPAEDGSAQVSRAAGDVDGEPGTRRERREAARADAKSKRAPSPSASARPCSSGDLQRCDRPSGRVLRPLPRSIRAARANTRPPRL
ncbi:hypothetical protein GS896_26020 [Rhodococcus hoagii]|nr:hypothetical protein [Prescottella equi]